MYKVQIYEQTIRDMKTYNVIYDLISEVNQIAIAKFGANKNPNTYSIDKYSFNSLSITSTYIAECYGRLRHSEVFTDDVELIISVTEFSIRSTMVEYFKKLDVDAKYDEDCYKIVLKNDGTMTMEEYK